MKFKPSESHIETPEIKKKKISRWVYCIAGIAVAVILATALFLNYKSNSKNATDNEPKYCLDHTGDITGTINGHEWVDLGLPSGLKWATCNIGADIMVEPGVYFAWGETETKDNYSSDNCITHRVPFSELKKKGIIDDSGILTKKHDAANQLWGSSWRMPTIDEFQELIKSCTWEFISVNDMNGYMVTGPNKRQIFLPAAAFKEDTEIDNYGEFGDYWSSSVVPDLAGAACSLGYSSKSFGRRHYSRYVGRCVRPVTD